MKFFERKSNILLVIACVLLLIGATMSVCDMKEQANYLLIAGMVAMIFRGLLREREQDNRNDEEKE